MLLVALSIALAISVLVIIGCGVYIGFLGLPYERNVVKQITLRNMPDTHRRSCVILTCTVDACVRVQQRDRRTRLLLYEKSLRYWLEKTNLCVVIVENSGHSFEPLRKHYGTDRFVCVSLGAKETNAAFRRIRKKGSKGQHELFAIETALRRARHVVDRCKFVVKVTGRYFIPGLEEILNRLPEGVDAIRQRDRNRCEVVGGTLPVARRIFRFPSPFERVEQYYERIVDKFETVYTLPNLPVPPVRSGGQNKLVKYL